MIKLRELSYLFYEKVKKIDPSVTFYGPSIDGNELVVGRVGEKGNEFLYYGLVPNEMIFEGKSQEEIVKVIEIKEYNKKYPEIEKWENKFYEMTSEIIKDSDYKEFNEIFIEIGKTKRKDKEVMVASWIIASKNGYSRNANFLHHGIQFIVELEELAGMNYEDLKNKIRYEFEHNLINPYNF